LAFAKVKNIDGFIERVSTSELTKLEFQTDSL